MKVSRLDKFGAALWLLMAGLVATLLVLQFKGPSPLQTNLLALLPATERDPVAEQAICRLADIAGDRAIFLVGASNDQAAFDTAKAFSRRLTQSGAFRQVLGELPPIDTTALTRLYQPYRYRLLTPEDLSALQHHDARLTERLQQKLYRPFHFGPTFPVQVDPFGFADNWLSKLPLRSWQLDIQNGMLSAQSEGRTWVLISADLPGSAYNSGVQDLTLSAVAEAEKKLGPHVELLRFGAVFYADAARRDAEHEVHWIGMASLIGMLILMYVTFRSLRPLALGLLSVTFGIGAAVAGTILAYDQIHLITLIFGASLTGEAIDYAIQYFAAHAGAGSTWEPRAGLRKITPGLTVALATSLLGYATLSLAPFPALAQIALFAFIGLLAAWVSVFLLLPAFMSTPSTLDADRLMRPFRNILQACQQLSLRRKLCMVTVLVVAALPGWFLLHGDDDIRQLAAREPGLLAQEQQIRSIIGLDTANQFFLVQGSSIEEALLREEQLNRQLDILQSRHALQHYQGVAQFVPSATTQMAAYTAWQNAVIGHPGLTAILEEAGLEDGFAQALQAAFHSSRPQILQLEEWLSSPISLPFRHLWMGPDSSHATFAAIVTLQGLTDPEALKDIAVPGVTLVDKTASVTTFFTKYRLASGLWICCAFLLIYLMLKVRYGWLMPLKILSPPALAMAITLGIFGYLQIGLTLFNMMGFMLVLGVGVNYAIFLQEGGLRAPANFAGVLLSAGTTLLSFGLLAFSSMHALHGFGITMLMGIGFTILLAPLITTISGKTDSP